MKWGCAIFGFSVKMPSPTLLECLNKYIPDHIFKNIVLDPADADYDNYCIIFDGCGCWYSYRFTKDDQSWSSIVYKEDRRDAQHDLYKMLRMKLWFDWFQPILNSWYFDNELNESDKKRMVGYIYNTYVMRCSKCNIAKYCDSFRCYECSSDYCLTCFTEDQDATIRIINHETGERVICCRGLEYPYEDTHKCWKH